ncbi:MAG: ribonuclease HI family protein [Chloroflexi bacterium]|nr:MAG: ribonuclease HI family protein [Chloroflexota bacterium]
MHGLPGNGHVQGHADAPAGGRDRELRELRPNPGARLTTLRLRADGGARGNPGPAALGVVIEDDQGMRLRTFHRFLGVATNNQAEYQALIEGLKAVADWKPDRLEVYLDSKLVVEQVNGKWRVKESELKELHKQATELLQQFGDRVTVSHVGREENRGADKLVNMALDERVKKPKPSG